MRNFLIKRKKVGAKGVPGLLGLSQLMLPQHAHAATTATSHNKFKYAANK